MPVSSGATATCSAHLRQLRHRGTAPRPEAQTVSAWRPAAPLRAGSAGGDQTILVAADELGGVLRRRIRASPTSPTSAARSSCLSAAEGPRPGELSTGAARHAGRRALILALRRHRQSPADTELGLSPMSIGGLRIADLRDPVRPEGSATIRAWTRRDRARLGSRAAASPRTSPVVHSNAAARRSASSGHELDGRFHVDELSRTFAVGRAYHVAGATAPAPQRPSSASARRGRARPASDTRRRGAPPGLGGDDSAWAKPPFVIPVAAIRATRRSLGVRLSTPLRAALRGARRRDATGPGPRVERPGAAAGRHVEPVESRSRAATRCRADAADRQGRRARAPTRAGRASRRASSPPLRAARAPADRGGSPLARARARR